MLWEKIKELEEKKKDLEEKILELEKSLKDLPSGHLEAKQINGKTYYYLRYWEDGRLKSKYIGKDSKDIELKLKKAYEIKNKLTLLKQEKERLERILIRILNVLDENLSS
ncbi:MAG: hypothetical protein JZD40_05415 [Sulfolobus sp.]|nr:hypothetical protein [Sulfolobus sp.]